VGYFEFSPLALRFGGGHNGSMPKRIRRQKDVSQWANQIVKESVEETPPPPKALVSKVMAEMGRKGGKVGGKRRLATMTDEERSEAASHAANARWAKTNGNKR
jgi:hypothetical protein